MILYIILLSVIIVLDQMSKALALANLENREPVLLAGGRLQLLIVRNTGAAFGILRDKQRVLKIVTGLLTAALLGYMVYAFGMGEPVSVLLPLTFVAGGAAGNLIDRYRRNFVVDFLTLKIRKFPVFNLADIFIFAGSLLYLVHDFFNA